jgi:apolipoprotein N-acyltransferase
MDTLGHAFYRANYFRQLADIGGAALLTFFIYWVNESLWTIWNESQKAKRLKINPQLGWVAFLCLIGWSYGWLRSDFIQQQISQSQRSLQAAAIQANIGDFDKLASERGVRGAAARVIQTFIELSDQANQLNPRPQVLIWPETSYPSTFRSPHSSTETQMDQEIENYSRKIDLPLLFGGYDRFQNKDFNAFFFLSPRGDLQIYRKNILLLFGEYIPGADRIDWIRDTFPQVGNFGRGEGPQVIPIHTQKSNHQDNVVYAGPIICYEALFPNYVIEAARKGSEFIINITNDSWFGAWGEPQLHLALTTFRSIETRLPMIRSTNTGISALVTADGEITHATQINRPEVMNVLIPLTSPIPTLIKTWGDWFGPTSFALGWLGIGLFAWLKSRHSQSGLKRKKQANL